MSGRGFFSDAKLQAFVASVANICTAFVETGTEGGDTARWVAPLFRDVFTCEIDEDYFALIAGNLPPNVFLSTQSSPVFLAAIRKRVGSFPLFFLDAHWQEYWPLLDELRAISQLYDRAVIIVHDCLVPNRDNFWSCRGGGVPNSDGPMCDWEYVKKGLSETNRYRLFYPIYSTETPGYCVLFQNCNPCGDLANFDEANALLTN